MSSVEAKKTRRPPARQKDVVMGCMEERLFMIPRTDDLEPHRTRLLELLDELKRSMNKDGSDE